MKTWFQQLPQREQMSLLLLAVVVFVYLVYMLVWSPVKERRDQMELQNRGVAESLQRVDVLASEVISLRGNSANRPASKRNLTSLINQSTARRQLQVSRLQPNSRGEIQVRLENAAFDDLMLWLHELEFGESVLVREVSITDSGTAGRVNATIRVAQTG